MIRCAMIVTIACLATSPLATGQSKDETSPARFAETFDAHWETLRDNYPYFELYGVDWEAERAEHRPRAVAAAGPTEFAWELARLISALPDPHVSFRPSMKTVKDLWSAPDVDVRLIRQRAFVRGWPEDQRAVPPKGFADDPRAYPEIVRVCGQPLSSATEILVAGPCDTTFDIRLRWPDGTETDHELRRPKVANLPPPEVHLGERWLVSGRVGKIGYMRVRTFDPKKATLGPDGKITTMLRAALAKLSDTDGLILDVQGNGGGLVAASDPFLGHFLERNRSYRWGNSGGRTRVIRAQKPRYAGHVVVIVDERSASGGEWAARILRDAGRATVIGGRTVGAEAAVRTSKGPDGSVVRYSGWPMAEPGVTPFQRTGVELDHTLSLTIEDARKLGFDEALARIRRARFAKALALLDAPADALAELVALAGTGDDPARKGSAGSR